VKVILADSDHIELDNQEATKEITFTIQEPITGTFLLEEVVSGFSRAFAIAFTQDDRLFVNDHKLGTVHVVNTNTWQLETAPFCQFDVSDAGTEKGLLGIALDPDFESNGFAYFYYSVSDGSKNVVVRVFDNNGVCEDETVIVDNLPSSGTHAGGSLLFGPDDKLYISLGDFGNSNRAQDLNQYNGKILRINKDGSIPSDNPFIELAETTTVKTEIWSYGHRNPFGIAFHDLTGDLWETENGPNNNDEINIIKEGENYGWNQVMGPDNGNPDYTDPLWSTGNDEGNQIAPTGIIAISQNSPYPTEYHNNILFGSWKGGGRIYRIILSGQDLDNVEQLTYQSMGEGGLLDFEYGPDGLIYVSNSGKIFRLMLN